MDGQYFFRYRLDQFNTNINPEVLVLDLNQYLPLPNVAHFVVFHFMKLADIALISVIWSH